ncbi:hypothetical protein DRF65_06675 [Chryseobacterium pennae]|uniref:DUF6705 domain-containing protein n=1 Tax=Chryseobacterium pennae TaxID=2258962 RepID=A0A3D9CBR8_9FLAO|nr:DUF6705 family protein [Chryseobacterium pennae]REC63330.1 hypothetical protein DRF65_06675 [Chryseobacterium pennae]
MNNLLTILGIFVVCFCEAQTIYSLRPTEINLLNNSYEKDTNNELQAYEGIWRGEWNNKIFIITLKKITNKYDNDVKRYRDYLVGRFIVKDSNEHTLFDNIKSSDDQAKIQGINFRRYGNKYSLIYNDPELCHITGNIAINFIDTVKTKLEWKYYQNSDWTDNDCFYHGLPQSQRPDPLPQNIILTKQ